MSLIEEYYELNEAEKVTSAWKVLQIVFCACAATSGLASGFTLAVVRQKFAERCYLFTEVKISHLKDDEKEQKIINWESDTWCDYYQFTMVSSFIVAIIWATLFLMCGKGGKSPTGLPQPWRIVGPSLIFNFVYFVIILGTVIRIQQGTDYFCGRKHFENKKAKSLVDKCESLKLLLKKDLSTTSVLLEVVLKTAWGCATSWLILFLLSFFRIIFVVDFQLYKICVFKIDDTFQNKREEVLKITSYEESKLGYYDEEEEKLARHQSEEILKDLEAGNKSNKKGNKFVRHYNISANHLMLKKTSTFYVAADVRMLNLEKKRKKCLRALDKAFESNSLGGELRKTVKIPPNSETSAKPKMQTFLHENSKDVNYKEKHKSEISSPSTSNKEDYREKWNESYGEIFVGDFNMNKSLNHSLRFKKQI